MSIQQGEELCPEEREQAGAHWEALMFAPNRSALESARVALTKAPYSVQGAVMANITELWLQEIEPRREDNPFARTD